MRVEIMHVDELTAAPSADAAVVIDVLRAFTVAPWCYARGADKVLLAGSVDAAVAAAAGWTDALLLKDGAADARFQLPNAPGAIAECDLSGRVVIQTTGNGTRGAHAVVGVPDIFCASFVTAAATARALLRLHPVTVAFVVTEGDEDVALADYLAAVLAEGSNPDPSSFLSRVANSSAAHELLARAANPSFPGVHPDDVPLSMQLDRFDFALRAEPAGDVLQLARR